MKLVKFLTLSTFFAALSFNMLGNIYLQNNAQTEIFYSYSHAGDPHFGPAETKPADAYAGIIPFGSGAYDTPSNSDELDKVKNCSPTETHTCLTPDTDIKCQKSGFGPYACLPDWKDGSLAIWTPDKTANKGGLGRQFSWKKVLTASNLDPHKWYGFDGRLTQWNDQRWVFIKGAPEGKAGEY